MFGEGFAEVHENYELAKVFSKIRDLDGLEFINAEIGKFWESRPIVSNDEYECITRCGHIVEGNLCDNIEGDLSGMWEYSLSGDLVSMAREEGDRLELFYGLKNRNLLTSNIIEFTRNRIEEMRWLGNSSIYTSLLGDFEGICLGKSNSDMYEVLSSTWRFGDLNPIVGR
jgi:hypothetical protein